MIRYRRLAKGDIESLGSLALKAWSHAYRGIYAPSTIRRKVSQHYSTESIGATLREARRGDSFFVVACDGEVLIGYANGGMIRNPWKNPSRSGGKVYRVSGWELQRIYLLPEYIGQGIGRELLDRWERFLRAKRADRYYVTYNSKNRLARDFYSRNGFARAKELDDGISYCAVKRLSAQQTLGADKTDIQKSPNRARESQNHTFVTRMIGS